MKAYRDIFISVALLSLLGVTCDETPYPQEDDITGIVRNSNNEPILGVRVINPQRISEGFSNPAGEYTLSNAFIYFDGTESKDLGCLSGSTSPSKVEPRTVIDFVLIFFHPDYDTTIAVISLKREPTENIPLIIQGNSGRADGRYDTLFSAQDYDFGRQGQTRVIPPVIMKPKK